MTEGPLSSIEVKTYDYNNITSMWKFEYVGSGFYKIKNDITDLYLTAPANDTEGTAIKHMTFSGNYSLWHFEQTDDGYYIIQSKNQYDRTTTTPLYLTVVNNSVVQSSSTAAYKWDVRALTLNLNVYYDQAFVDLYEEIEMTAGGAIDNIFKNNTLGADNYRSISQAFKESLGIRLNAVVNTSVFESFPYTQDCDYKDDPLTPCQNCKNSYVEAYENNGSEEAIALEYCKNGYHHKCSNKIIKSTPASNTTINILFTGHKTSCSLENIETAHAIEPGELGRAEGVASGNRCAVYLSEFSSIQNYQVLKIVAIHEITHLINGQHHYENEEAGNCVHGGNHFNDDNPVSIPICDICDDNISLHKLRILYPHNP